jgi:integrase
MLTELQIKTAQPKEKKYRLYDQGGMFLEIRPHGSKAFHLKYRFGGKEQYLALGQYPMLSLKEARVKRDEARKLVSEGINPCEVKKAKKKALVSQVENSFEVVAREWHSQLSNTWKPNHAKTVMSRLERDLIPWLGDKEIDKITAPELLAVLKRVEGRGAIETAHRELVICGQIMRYANATGRTEKDVTVRLRGALKSVESVPLAAITEPKKVGELLRMIDGYRGGFVVASALKLAPLVFVRPGELRMAKWADIDLGAALWSYRVTKTKTDHIVPLSTQAIAILSKLKPLTGRGEWVFPGGRSNGRPMSENGLLAALRSLGVEKDEMCGHGFRAMARTLLDEELGFAPHLIEHQLAHEVRDALGRSYNRTQHLDQRVEMMQRWADYLDGLKKL